MSLLRDVRNPLPLQRSQHEALIAYAVRFAWFSLVVMIGWFVLGVAVFFLTLPSGHRLAAAVMLISGMLLGPASAFVAQHARRWRESVSESQRRPT